MVYPPHPVFLCWNLELVICFDANDMPQLMIPAIKIATGMKNLCTVFKNIVHPNSLMFSVIMW